jgi:hypothetical protein
MQYSTTSNQKYDFAQKFTNLSKGLFGINTRQFKNYKNGY